MKKKISAGLILTDGKKFLVCHSTSNWFFDLPKGMIKEEELPIDACIREVREETGLKISKGKLKDLGTFVYNKKKDLHLFLLETKDLPDIKKMKCVSLIPFTNKLEVDSYKYIPFDKVGKYMVQNMVNVIKTVIAGWSIGRSQVS